MRSDKKKGNTCMINRQRQSKITHHGSEMTMFSIFASVPDPSSGDWEQAARGSVLLGQCKKECLDKRFEAHFCQCDVLYAPCRSSSCLSGQSVAAKFAG